MHRPALVVALAWILTSPCLANTGRCGIPGDDNGDCRIAFDDVEKFVACMAGPETGSHPLCACQDFDDDADIDLLDFAGLQSSFSGDDLIPGCDLTPRRFEPGPHSAPLAARGIGPVRWMAPESLRAAPPDAGGSPPDKERETLQPWLFSGAFYLQAVDLRIRGRGLDFVWGRTYRSQNGPDSPQGVGWDHSYNVRLEAQGGDLVLHDGNGRFDTYYEVPGPTGTTWCTREFFRTLTQDPNGSYICMFAQRGTWRFLPLDGTPAEGRLRTIADTNGNRLQLNYDVNGRLATVTDTLNRTIAIGYNTAGRIASVTDFTGRQVTYDYYTSVDSAGDDGDLRSVTSPTVTGTPTGNDFPGGKTTLYTYTRGRSVPELNHNLLTVTDPKGQTFLVNTYAATLDPNAPGFDRVVQQQIGNVNDQVHYAYEPLTPTAANGYAVGMTIVNDRNGHVSEYLYDRFNRCVERRRLTGQANPNLPTDLVSNRPTGALRAGDPNAFVSTYRYNGDALPTRLTDAAGSVRTHIFAGDLDPFATARSRANLLSRVREAGPRGGDQQQLVDSYTYDSLLSGDTNRVTQAVDPRGHVTTHAYDSAGNLLQTTERIASVISNFTYNSFGQLSAHIHPDNGSGHRRRDEFSYYANGPQTGYLERRTQDATGFALATQYEYDAVGNVTRTIDPRGNDALRIYNALDQVVRELSRVPGANQPRYAVDTIYDENDNIVRVEVQNLDENGVLQANQSYTAVHSYDTLDHLLSASREVDPNHSIVTEYLYDGERNRTLVRSGEATSGHQPTSTMSTLYDERDLVYRRVHAAGDPDQATDQFDYDGNGNAVVVSTGLEDAVPRITTHVYDGYDRLVSTTDPVGNATTLQYDENGNEVLRRVDGELQDVPGSGGNVRLLETVTLYDPLDRVALIEQSFFDCATQIPLGDGLSSTIIDYSDTSQVLRVTDDNAHQTTYAYDSMNRTLRVTDAGGNRVEYGYDGNSNVISETETARADLGGSDEVFLTTYSYDALDRRIGLLDSAGNQQTCGYDSRGNLVVHVDAEQHERRCAYDGLNRLTRQTFDLDGDGADGDGPDIVVRQAWDDNSRCVRRTDDNGNHTSYVYDALDRCVHLDYADGTSASFTYDVHGNCVSHVDANGTTVISTYDARDRLTGRTIAAGVGVSSDTTFETFAYDGLSRIVSAQDDDAVLTYAWDSLSHPLRETLNGDVTSAGFDGVGNRLLLTYPGGQQVRYAYDALDRVAQVLDGNTPIAAYDYVGPDRVARQTLQNGVETTFAYDGVQGVPNPPLDHGVKQIVQLTHSAAGNPVDQRTFAWDAMHNKREQRDVRPGGPGSRWAYDYDAAYRLTQELFEDGIGIPLRLVDLSLDGVGNRLQLSGFGTQTGPYQLDPSSPPADFQANQYTSTPRDTRSYDENGNLAQILSGPVAVICEYDYANRLVAWENLQSQQRITFAYDPAGRRIAKSDGAAETRYRYAMSGAVLEELDPNGASQASYVYGAHQGGIVCVKHGMLVFYQQRDDLGSVVALTDPNGAVLERYEYDDFGQARITDAGGSPLPASAVGNVYRFRGLRLDAETGWYLNGSRYIDPVTGRYVVRSETMWNGHGLGNGRQFLGGNPASHAAPSVLARGRPAVASGPLPYEPGDCSGGDACGGGSRSRSVAQPCPHVTILKIARAGGDNHCPGCGAMLCRCKDGIAPAPPCSCGRYHGHVTILKAQLARNGGSDGQCGGAATDERALREFRHEAKVMGRASGPGCVCLTEPCVCGAAPGCRPTIVEPVLTFPVYHLVSFGGGSSPDIGVHAGATSAGSSPFFGGGGMRHQHGPKCPCANCGPCLQHGTRPRWFCKGDHTTILPAANNISSR